MEAVEVEGLRFAFKDREVLSGVTFSVHPGEIFGLLGPNGGGKTTLFRILTTLLGGALGRAAVFGVDLIQSPDLVRREIGVVFQSQSLDKKLSVLENLTHQGHLYGMRGFALRAKIDELLARFSLTDRTKERVEKLSGGLKRRVELAKGLLHGPKLLILDEPTAGLDPGARREFWAELERQRKEGLPRPQGAGTNASGKTTILFTTHLMEEADRCDRVAILDKTIVALDAPDALKRSIGGDIVTVRAADSAALQGEIEASLGVKATLLDGSVRIEGASTPAPELVSRIAQTFGPRVESITLGKPTLEDVFVQKTGRRFVAA